MALLKFSLLVFIIGIYLLCTCPLLIMFWLNPNKTRKVLNNLVSLFSRILLSVLGVKIECHGNVDKSRNYFIVSNHLSYLDILIISSLKPTSFVTSMEMKKTPLLGQVTILGGCLFVERRSRKNILKEISEIEDALSYGLSVVVFPEAKSTNGEKVLEFKRSLFQASINTKTSIMPVALNYSEIDKEKVTLKNRDSLFWYDDMNFFTHILNLCRYNEVSVEVNILESIPIDDKVDSTSVRDESYKLISDKFKEIEH